MSPRAVTIPLDQPGAWEKLEKAFRSDMPLEPRDKRGWVCVYGQISARERGRPVFVKGKRDIAKAQAAALAEAVHEAGYRAWCADPDYPFGRYASFGRAEEGQEAFDHIVQRENQPRRHGV